MPSLPTQKSVFPDSHQTANPNPNPQKIPCEFNLDLPLLGHLDANPSHPLRKGTKLSLPLWLAEMLALAAASPSPSADAGGPDDTHAFASLNLPPALAGDVVAALKADARAVPLRDRSAHFYALATRMLDLFEERELGTVLRRAYVLRAGDVATHARKAGGREGGGGAVGGGAGEEFLRGLDEWERALFRKAHEGSKASREYLDNIKKY
jgi:GINS complex subunit 3